jgi:hypothetical protein
VRRFAHQTIPTRRVTRLVSLGEITVISHFGGRLVPLVGIYDRTTGEVCIAVSTGQIPVYADR